MKRLAWLVAMLAPASAAAYSDRELFDEPSITGGAGGRYFTGSRLDGYACSTCHAGATSEDFTIAPLPDELVAGTRYDLRITWAHADKPHSLNLELARPDGSHPMVVVPTGTAVPRESRCELAANGTVATYTIDVGARRVVGVEPCGASMVSLSFVATGGPIELSIGAIAGDASETPIGDASFERRITLGVTPAGPNGGCASAPGAGLGAAFALLAILSARSRTAR